MAEVTINLEEYKTLIKVRERYAQLLSVIGNNSEIHFRTWDDHKAYMVLDSDKVLEALQIIDHEVYESIYLAELVKAQEEAEEKEADESEGDEDVVF